jgi:hypothetical protein
MQGNGAAGCGSMFVQRRSDQSPCALYSSVEPRLVGLISILFNTWIKINMVASPPCLTGQRNVKVEIFGVA